MYYLVINYKTYPQSTGAHSEHLTSIVDNVQRHSDKVQIIICPQATDIYRLKLKFPHIHMWAQHADPLPANRNTGWITPHALKSAGASGALVNHSEHEIIDEMAAYTINALWQEKMHSCLLFPHASLISEIKKAHAKTGIETPFQAPTFAAYEPPELVGGEYSALDDSENFHKSQTAVHALKEFNTIPLLGAGVRDGSDISNSIKIGFAGVIVASGFDKSEHPQKFLEDMVGAFPH
jgi:triosephosphate isomerase